MSLHKYLLHTLHKHLIRTVYTYSGEFRFSPRVVRSLQEHAIRLHGVDHTH